MIYKLKENGASKKGQLPTEGLCSQCTIWNVPSPPFPPATVRPLKTNSLFFTHPIQKLHMDGWVLPEGISKIIVSLTF